MDVAVETKAANEAQVERLLNLARDACIVSRSVKRGIDFEIEQTLSIRP